VKDWRDDFPDAAAELRRWVGNRLAEIRRGDIRVCREALLRHPRWRKERAWAGTPELILDELGAAALRAARSLEAPDPQPQDAQGILGEIMTML
jgi:hypothetical protein